MYFVVYLQQKLLQPAAEAAAVPAGAAFVSILLYIVLLRISPTVVQIEVNINRASAHFLGFGSGSVRGPFGIRSGSVQGLFGRISDQNFRTQKIEIQKKYICAVVVATAGAL